MNGVNRSEMIYRVQREPTMAFFWTVAAPTAAAPTAADRPTNQPASQPAVSTSLHRTFSPSFTLLATSTAAAVPVSCNKSVQMVRYIVGGTAAGCSTTQHGVSGLWNSSALTDGQNALLSGQKYVKTNFRGCFWTIAQQCNNARSLLLLREIREKLTHFTICTYIHLYIHTHLL